MNKHILEASGNRSFKPGDLAVEVGESVFVTTGTTVEVTTDFTEIVSIFLTPKTVTYNANDQLSSDGVVTSGAVTVARNSSGTSALGFYYVIYGRTNADV